MGAAQKILEPLENVENSVNAEFYSVSADYYKVNKSYMCLLRPLKGLSGKAEYASYYKNSLLYFACVDVETGLSSEERLARAHGLGISALFGDTIYNFGELVCYRRASLPLTTIEFTPQPDSMNG